ncbi:50S ribosomal protein L10 [Candidatus Roizmanbacteria bacterium RIFCSPLOWO2_02_FULL_37_19]|uniref:Large ribosomal subunit protein uL10 n=1 Tax=Candidatus Roizmanbacteria bacterium RIFCSPHIGHO2_02_FULL_37_24 TaxID=1802037 RepID=A0A1F7GV85_9BACT|nr:MAG: 50S ribosomal protein L10 [Candidatus Roizmanbacteria bacterium RIFCSPHIGHO2_01_FULL_38_41]OGK22997.1 MAG: 50S ribosomal protein L10 [Candidatus Roizmanbacteria bacterium RIFCSPHIGHO2_02_FULL_37_24]OGK32222.1 MAG: 50S ribosomal protein L10 [Candidatus Roizmanbacteria bacterium RIFCSPHIGHO2_12_FULL_37_23]OGK45650.1 MAG: 50S ribosomal protein L10 [Candidatus Roizmanbacteria bacterium RIFCSPLOWO2_01_FULL_37_57]OGK53855.1 MAG: 50S ribosomal protein L10 [Candidatus Roizmanbacteria bacterium 
MPNLQKREYVSQLYNQLAHNPHFVLVGFTTSSHKRLENLRKKLRETGNQAHFTVIKNTLLNVALSQLQLSNNLYTKDVVKTLQGNVRGQSALLFLSEDWMSGLKAFHQFSKEEEGLIFKVGLLDGEIYEEAKLVQLAVLPGKNELIAKIITSLRSPHSRTVFSMRYSSMKLIQVLKNASEKSIKN